MIKKILLVYCNLPKEPLLPLSIGYLTAVLKKLNVEVDLFDTTSYVKDNGNDQKAREESGQVKSVGDYIKERSYEYLISDFREKLKIFNPELVCFTCTEATHYQTINLIEEVNKSIKVAVGGSFATFCPQYFFNITDYVCVGDGEKVIEEIVYGNKLYENTRICYNFVDNLEYLPTPDFSLFSEDRYLRPMGGKLYKMVPIEIGRGCPFKCSYCSASSYKNLFKEWRRTKSVSQIMREMRHYKLMGTEYFYLISESFGTDKIWLEVFMEHYDIEAIDTPFWFNTRPEVINKLSISILRYLSQIGCHRISMGIEHGNEEFRKALLNRNYSNEDILKAVYKINNAGIELSVNNMIGFPDETEYLLKDTIELNKHIEADSYTVSVFQPYRGTKLHKYCVNKGYFSDWAVCGEQFSESVLDMPKPYLNKEEINRYYKSFNELIKV